jgi:hypothetical protein
MKAVLKRTRAWLIAPVAAIVAALVLAPVAGADPVTGGKTVLKFDQNTGEGFADMSIGIDTTGAAKSGKNGFSFPIKGGDVSEGPKGEIDHRGGLAFFTEGGPGVKFTKFAIKIGKNKTKLFAKSGHAEVRFLDLDLSDATIGGSAGTDLKIKGADATLAKAGAEVLSTTFDFPFHKGIPMGTVTVKASLTS